MNLLRAIAASVFLLAGFPAVAQDATDPERLAEARAILAAIHMEKQLDNLMPIMADAMTKQVVQGQSAAKARVMQITMEESMKGMKERILAPGGFMESITIAYAQAFTFGELRQIRTFYESQAGQRLLQAQPEIMRGLMPKMMESTQNMIPEMCSRVKARLIAEKLEGGEAMKCPEVK